MLVKGIRDEDFTQYKKASMFVATCYCDWKCCHDGGFPESVCQNNELAQASNISVDNHSLIKRYQSNPITHSIVFGGLEPMLQFEEICDFLSTLRAEYNIDDTVVIYTGYDKCEIEDKIQTLTKYGNIIIKYGRFKMNSEPRFDNVLGVTLASNNQYAEKIS